MVAVVLVLQAAGTAARRLDGEGDVVSADEPLSPAPVMPARGDHLRLDLGDGVIHHAIVAYSRTDHDGRSGTIRLISDPTNGAET